MPKAFEFTKLFRRQQSAIPLFLFVDKFPGFAQNSFEKSQAAICLFSKEFCENPGNVLIKGIKFQKRIVNALFLQQSFLNSKEFGVKRLRTNKFNILLKGELKKIWTIS